MNPGYDDVYIFENDYSAIIEGAAESVSSIKDYSMNHIIHQAYMSSLL